MTVPNRMKIVSTVRCDDYSREKVAKSVAECIDLLGGLGKFVRKGDRILVKPNLLRASPIEKGVTTHPEIVFAISKLLQDHGCNVLIGDSPGGGTPYTERALRKSYHAAGLDAVAKELGVELNFSLEYKNIPSPNSRKIKRFNIITPALEADAIVNVAKMKTHLFTYITGATKNTFGVIPSMEKATFHSRLKQPDDFAEMLVDLNELIKPRLNILDAVMAMEGDGPNSGKMRKMGIIAGSDNYAALDVVESKLMSIDPKDVGVVKAAIKRKLLGDNFEDVKVVGEEIENLIAKDFKKPKTYIGPMPDQGMLWRALASMAKSYAMIPVIKKKECNGCKECYRICPQSAIAMRKDRPHIDYGKCIRCYCCHETCPNDAISLDWKFTGKLMKRLVK